jgi:hypothetical protein
MLTNSDTEEIISDTSSEKKWGGESGQWSCDCGEDLDEGVGCYTGVEACRVVVEEVENTTELSASAVHGQGEVDVHSGKGDVDNVRQLRLISWSRAIPERKDIVELGQSIDGDRDESSLEVVTVLHRQLRQSSGKGEHTQNNIQAAIQVLPRAYQGAYLKVPFSTWLSLLQSSRSQSS